MRLVLSWIAGFGRFWYHFIIGDDWTVAAVVGIGLLVIAVLHAAGVDAWWLMPVLVIVILGVSVRRARRA